MNWIQVASETSRVDRREGGEHLRRGRRMRREQHQVRREGSLC